MPTISSLTPKKRAALQDCARGPLARRFGGYALIDSATVHSKRVVNQLATDGLVNVSEFERTVEITSLGRDLAGAAGLASAA